MANEDFFNTRPITDEERDIALRWVPSESIGCAIAVTAFAMFMVGLVLYGVYHLTNAVSEQAGEYVLWASGVITFVAVPAISAWLAVREHRHDKERRRQIQEELALGFVEVARVRPLDVVQLDFPPQQEPAMVFRIDETRAVALHLVDVEEKMPNTDFEYVRLPRSKIQVRTVTHGTELHEVKHVEGEKAAVSLDQQECEPFPVEWDALTEGAVVMSPGDTILYERTKLAGDCPSFDEAVQKLRTFLAANSHPDNVQWVFKEDLTSRKCGMWVRLPLASDNQEWARRCYEVGLKKGLGIKLEMLCVIGDTSFCYVWFPSDECEAEQLMLKGLKLSAPTEAPDARSGRPGLVWRLRAMYNRHQGWEGVIWNVLPRSEAAFKNRL